jgi:hypothetical protein
MWRAEALDTVEFGELQLFSSLVDLLGIQDDRTSLNRAMLAKHDFARGGNLQEAITLLDDYERLCAKLDMAPDTLAYKRCRDSLKEIDAQTLGEIEYVLLKPVDQLMQRLKVVSEKPVKEVAAERGLAASIRLKNLCGVLPEDQDPTEFVNVLVAWLDYCAANNLTPETQLSIVPLIKAFIARFDMYEANRLKVPGDFELECLRESLGPSFPALTARTTAYQAERWRLGVQVAPQPEGEAELDEDGDVEV